MKRFLGIFFALFIPVVGICAITYYSDTEQKYYFGPDAVKSTLEQFVEKEETRIACAELYTSLMNQENGQVSVTDLFAVCRKAGFNTYRKDGFDKCREFVNGLLASNETGDIDEMMSGFCPAAYDENGKQQNGLKSIGEQTRIGDFCSSTNIAGGEVVFRKGYNCTCAAYACNPGFQSEKGACVTEYKDANGNCLRKEYINMTNIKNAEEALKFCESKAIKGCKVRNAIRNFGGVKGHIVCNATRDEVDNVKARMLLNHEKKVAGLKYYAVCQKGVEVPSGARAHCVEKVFNWVNVGMVEGDGLAKLYAKEKDGKTIYCSTNPPREHLNDDYLQCATMDGKDFYEFQFDDLSESNDKNGGALVFTHDKLEGVVNGLSIIYGGQVAGKYSLNGSCQSSTNKKIVNAARNFGLVSTNTSNGKNCKFSYNTIEDESKLATIDGIDNYVFYHEIQIQGSDATRLKLEKYIRGLGIKVTSFKCDTGYGKIAKKAILGLKEKDDVWRCNLNGQPIDFVFDDTSEAVKTTQEAGEAGMTCIISGGAYANKKCHGLDQNQCTQVNAKLKAENPKSSGTKWQNGQCILIDVQEQNRLENGIQIGLSIIALADCATVIIGNAQGVMGCTLAVVEITGLATELTTGAAMQKRADDFIKIADACDNRSCAKNTLKTMAGKALTVQDALKSASTAYQIDVQLARLVEYLEPEDLQSEVSPNDWDDIVRQLGGDPNDTAGRALKVANKIGFIAQFASLGASALRLTGRAIAKVASKSAAKTAASGTKALAIVGTHADDATSAFAKTTAHADDAARVADNTADATRGASTGAKAAGQADDATRGAATGAKAAGQADDATRGASTGAKAAGQADDATRGASQATNTTNDIVYDMAYFSRNASGTDDVFKSADDLVQINRQNMSANVLRDLMKKAKQYGFECTDCGGGVLKFSKTADKASDATRATNNAADATRGASKVDDVSDATKGASKTTSGATTGASTATRGATKVDDVATRFGSIKMLQSDEDIILDAIAKKRAGTLSTAEHRKAIRTMDKYFDEGQAVRYAQQMRQDIIESVRLHPDEFVMAGDKGEDFARFLVKYVGPKYGIKSGQLKVMSAPIQGGYAQYVDGVLYLQPNLGGIIDDYDRIFNIVVHEFGHAIDDLAPQYGVIGKSLNAYGDLNALYVNPGELFDGGTDMYRLIPTERSSHLLGDMVSGTTNYGETKSGSLLSKELAKVLDAGNISADEARIANIATLRQQASKSFDQYLAEVKNSYSGKGAKLPKSRLNDAGWNEINKSLAAEDVQLVETTENGQKYMQFVRANHVDDAGRSSTGNPIKSKAANTAAGQADDVARGASSGAIPTDFSPAARGYINEINNIGKNSDYVIIRGTGPRNNQVPFSAEENSYINQLLRDRDDLISMNFTQADGSGGTLGANMIIVRKTSDMFSVETENGIKWFRRIKTRSIDNLQGKAITTINGKKVFLEPLDNGDLIGNVSGRPVVVVNYDGHKIPFYTSSGSAGKLKVPTGKWEVFFGFGPNGTWFNKADINSIVGHYGSSELRQIAQALDNVVGDQRNVEDVFSTISRKSYNGIGNVASYDGPSVSASFINGMLDFTPIDYGGAHTRLLSNIEHVKGYFK